MKAILWTQGVSAVTPSTMVIDGVLCDGEQTAEKEQAYGQLVRYAQRPSRYGYWIARLRQRGIITTEQFRCTHTRGEGIYIQTVSDTCDERGRRIGIMFYCATEDMAVACATLRTYAQKAGRKVVEQELVALEKIAKYVPYVLPVALTITLIIIAIVAWKMN